MFPGNWIFAASSDDFKSSDEYGLMSMASEE